MEWKRSKVRGKTVIENFYPDFSAAMNEAEEKSARLRLRMRLVMLYVINAGRMMVIKYGPTENSLLVLDSRNAEILKHILKKSVLSVQSAVSRL